MYFRQWQKVRKFDTDDNDKMMPGCIGTIGGFVILAVTAPIARAIGLMSENTPKWLAVIYFFGCFGLMMLIMNRITAPVKKKRAALQKEHNGT